MGLFDICLTMICKSEIFSFIIAERICLRNELEEIPVSGL